LWSDEYVATYQAITGWATGHIALPGGVARQMQQMVRENTMITDRLVVGRDDIIPEASAAPLIGLVGSPDKRELRLDAGHVGLLVGRTAAGTTLPTLIDFLKQRSEVMA